MSEVQIGDLVQWQAGAKIRVGVVKEISADGTATLSVQTPQGSREEKIKANRLEVITSTLPRD